jgi:bifunctional ADP-heptose synthase (sugar kinase/adenylyltransferase)
MAESCSFANQLAASAERLFELLDTVDAVVCSDYGDGVFTPPVIEAALSHSRTIVDAQKGSSPSFPKSASGLMSVSNIN